MLNSDKFSKLQEIHNNKVGNLISKIDNGFWNFRLSTPYCDILELRHIHETEWCKEWQELETKR